jgi:hypothetical protein
LFRIQNSKFEVSDPDKKLKGLSSNPVLTSVAEPEPHHFGEAGA